MAFAAHKADTLNLIASPRVFRTVELSDELDVAYRLNLIALPRVFHAGLMDESGDEVSALKWMGEKWGPSDEKAFQAWKTAWYTYSEDTRPTIDTMVDAEIFALTDDWKDIAVLSAEEAVFGVCNEGRMITWDDEKPLPDIDVVV